MVKIRKMHENILYAAHTRARFVHGQGARGFITYEVVWRPRSGRSELAKRASNPRQVIAHRRSRQVIITPGEVHSHLDRRGVEGVW